MMQIPTFLGSSKIHGTGCFAALAIKKGQCVWMFKEGLDVDHPAFLSNFSDNARFINHAEQPNTGLGKDGKTIALRNIKEGEEITENYHRQRRICAGGRIC